MANLQTALNNCSINFDQPILITNLIDEYEIPFEDAQKTLQEYISEEEKNGTKFDKRFLVKGNDKANNTTVYTVANNETKLQEWLRKLQNAESSLYSVQIAGGAKAAAYDLKPLKYCRITLQNLEHRNVGNYSACEQAKNDTIATKVETKQEDSKKGGLEAAFAKQPTNTKSKTEPKTKKSALEVKQTTPEDKKTADGKTSSAKKGISNFFAPSTPAGTKSAENKINKGSTTPKPPTPKKMQDFFKKQSGKPTPQKSIKTEPVNTSVQLFTDEELDNEEAESSDEEEKLEILKREIISSDLKENQDDNTAGSSNAKRRRILDSDDEEDVQAEPQSKIEKIDSKDDKMDTLEEESEQKSETYLDEDGFVVTIKPKKSNNSVKKKTTPKKSPPSKSPMKKTAKVPPAAPSKTKQGNIMSFFTKK